MKNAFWLLLMILITSCSKDSKAVFEPVYMGLNGKLSSVEITNYNGSEGVITKDKPFGDFQNLEVYTFDDQGHLSEKCTYADPAKKVLEAKDIYKRDQDGKLVETYVGFNLNDNHYIGESLWRMIENKDGKERWQKIDENDWWGTSYKEIEYIDNKKQIKNYVIQKKSGETSNQESITQTFNERGQMISEIRITGGYPQNTITWTYNDKGHLLKEETEQLRTDGTVNKVKPSTYTIDKEDENNNPLQVTDDRGWIKTYQYFYQE